MQPFTIVRADNGTSLATFDGDGNLILAGNLYQDGTAPAPGAAVAGTTGALALVATTGTAGVALADSTPSLLEWTPPADGQLHRVLIICQLFNSSGVSGGAVGVTAKDPAGNSVTLTVQAGSQSAGPHTNGYPVMLVEAGQPVTISQTSALTAGTSTAWAEIWGS